MAPKTPPGAPTLRRDPRGVGSSSNNRVQKKPAPLRPSASQSSGRNQALRGPSGSNAAAQNATGAETVSSWTSRVESEEDEHAATQVDLAMLGTALNESIRDNHAELERRVNSGGNSPQLAEVSRHLLESPPSSPDSIHSDGSPKSPGAIARLAKIQAQELNELSKKDAVLHRMMSDLSGIQEWWKGNKIIWHEMRERIRQYDSDISGLQAQAEQHRRMVRKSGMSTSYGSTADFVDERWAPQIEQLKQMRDANLGWFVNNRKLMKAVWSRVKEMGDTLYTENKDNRKLGSRYPATRDITKFNWYQDLSKGVRWWIKATGDDIIILRDKIQAALDTDRARADQRDQQLSELKRKLRATEGATKYDDSVTDGQISELQDLKPRGYEAQISQILTERRAAKIKEMREAYDQRAMINDLEIRERESIFMRKHLTEIRERNRQMYLRLKETRREMPRVDPYTTDALCYFYEKFYHIVRHHIHRTVLALEFAGMLDQVSYAQDKRSQIIEQMELYGGEGYNTDEFLLAFQSQLVPQNGRVHYRALSDVAAVSSSEGRDFKLMVRTCQAIIDAPEPPLKIKDKENAALYLVPDVQNVVLNKPPPETPFNLARTLGSNITLAVAKTILEQVPSEPEGTHADQNYPWYELLRNFFVSSDIFPLFRSNTVNGVRRSWNRDEFINYVNSLLRTPVERRILEAFLAYCSHTGDLFRLTEFRRRVDVISAGWELCEENRPMGLYRKVPLSTRPRPQGIDRLEQYLHKYWRELECGSPDREVDDEDLRRFLNAAMPNDQRISKEKLRQCVSYWSSVGQFFSLLNP